MAVFRRAMVYLGLVDEPEDDDVGLGSRAPDAGPGPGPGPNVRPLSREDGPAGPVDAADQFDRDVDAGVAEHLVDVGGQQAAGEEVRAASSRAM